MLNKYDILYHFQRPVYSISQGLRVIKWAYQRVRRGYDDRIFWGFGEYFDKFYTPLQEFCERAVENNEGFPAESKHLVVATQMLEKFKSIEDGYEEISKFQIENPCIEIYTVNDQEGFTILPEISAIYSKIRKLEQERNDFFYSNIDYFWD